MAKLALNWSPQDPMAFFIVGMVASREGHVVEAERAFRQVTSLDSKNPEAWTRLSVCLLDMADARGAGIAAERACELAPQAPPAIRAKALAEYLTNHADAFQRDLEMLRQLAPPLAKEVEDRSHEAAIMQMSTERAIRDEAARVELRRNSIGMEFALIRPQAKPDGGRFQMGSPVDEKFRSPGERRHWVQLTLPYSIGVTEVTQGQFHRVTGANPSEFNHGDEQLPVENVTWADAVEFCRRLSDMAEERQEGHSYRLPTEAEWEYACRAGSAEQHHFGQETRWLRRYAWIAPSRPEIRTLAVGQKAPNRWGLHDMLGNVAEWCSDWYAELPEEEQRDPVGPLSGEHHVMRGGSWSLTNGPPRSATRGVLTFQEKSNTVGFRVVLVSP
jgi:formylglycine-generating enzyme required for sulfatase activity